MRKLGVIVYQGPSLLDGSEIVAILTRGSAIAIHGAAGKASVRRLAVVQ